MALGKEVPRLLINLCHGFLHALNSDIANFLKGDILHWIVRKLRLEHRFVLPLAQADDL